MGQDKISLPFGQKPPVQMQYDRSHSICICQGALKYVILCKFYINNKHFRRKHKAEWACFKRAFREKSMGQSLEFWITRRLLGNFQSLECNYKKTALLQKLRGCIILLLLIIIFYCSGVLFVEISLGHCWTVSTVSAGIGWSKGKWFYVFFGAQRNKRELMLIKDNKGMFLFLRCLNDMEKRQKF